MALQKEWVILIQQKLERGGRIELNKPWEKHCIYKVPNWVKDERYTNNNVSYTPEIISIGPYHRGLPHLQQMEDHKWRVLNHILTREGQDIKPYLTEVKKLEEQARACYDVPIGLNSNQFVKMLVLDGCFMLEFLRGKQLGYNNLKYGYDDPIFDKDSICHVITMDMMKLENQIPIFVIQKLLEIQYNRPIGDADVSVQELVMFALTPKWVTINAPMSEVELAKMRNAVATDVSDMRPMVHCLDVFRRSLLYKPKRKPIENSMICGKIASCARSVQKKLGSSSSVEIEHVMGYCISDLIMMAGIKLRPRHELPFCEIKFKECSGVLEIHPLKIHSATETVFRNLIAYEQCHMRRAEDLVITNYVAFMDNLIDTAEDVAYLHKAGILVHYLGSHAEVASRAV